MKNTFLKTTGSAALAILIMAAFSQISVSAQDRGNEEETSMQEREVSPAPNRPARALEGSWNHQVTRLNCQTGTILGTFPAMFTFARGGTFWEAGSNTSPALRSPSHGVWSYQSSRQFTTAFQFFRFNADGTPAGRQVVRQQIELSHDGNSYTATATSQILDVNGNVLATNCSAGTATRFQ